MDDGQALLPANVQVFRAVRGGDVDDARALGEEDEIGGDHLALVAVRHGVVKKWLIDEADEVAARNRAQNLIRPLNGLVDKGLREDQPLLLAVQPPWAPPR